MIASTALPPWQPPLQAPLRLRRSRPSMIPFRRTVGFVQAYRRGGGNSDGFGEAWNKVWRGANDGFEKFVFEARKTAESLDRRYSVSRRVSSVAQSAADRAREIDREFGIGLRWRNFTLDFSRNWPRYRRQLNEFMDTPLGKSFVTIFFLWFALSGWLFRFLIFATWILPFAGPLLIGTFANSLVIKGTCPACNREFAGYKNQIISCTGCGNIVWQPKGQGEYNSRKGSSSSKSQPNVIDVEFEEK
ncbi:unnamed protein product [Citrullus colocynthis]|uniref:Uncharacterized protein n=1 Tax=Citrullus colocynthis TaxID=252529 RepID=A0ABP0XUI9_9ROSI